MQVWFQNRRARYRKQERTGSVSLRSKYRQKRLQKLQQNHMTAATMTGTGMYAGYYSAGPSQTMLASPQPVSPYMSGFAFPPSFQNTLASGVVASSNGADTLTSIPTTMASPSYLPGFNAIKGSIPLPGYMTMGLNHNGGSPYGSAYNATPTSVIATPVSQK